MKEIPKSFKKWAAKAFKSDMDKIDVFAEYDRSLTTAENKTLFAQKFSSYFKQETKDLAEAKEEMAAIDRKSQIDTLQSRFGIELKFVMG